MILKNIYIFYHFDCMEYLYRHFWSLNLYKKCIIWQPGFPNVLRMLFFFKKKLSQSLSPHH